jgi:L-alanine-DL-glutamate epimerase-like enolase superfamily enzyme
MKTQRRQFLKSMAVLGAGASLPSPAHAASPASPANPATSYPYLGRTDDYAPFRIIEPGLRIARIESWTLGGFGVVKLTTDDGKEGWGQLSPFEPDLSAIVLHRLLSRQVLGSDPSEIDTLVDRVIDANMKFPWSFICRALTGVDTAIWDLAGKIKGKPVCELAGGKTDPLPAYGSSMRRDISPEAEAERLVQLRDSHGFKAFKVRLGTPAGHNRDASPGRTEKLIPTIRKALGENVALLADANSCYTPPKAIEVGRRMEDNNYYFFEEPCPYWELEWTAEVAAALNMKVAGGEQDNDMAQWRRMILMDAVDIVQPDICYIGGFTRAWRVAQMAAKAGKLVVPHSANLSLVTLFTMHLMAAIPNPGPFLEFTIEGDLNKGGTMYRPALEIEDGKVKMPEEPGWGVEINPDWLSKAQHQVSQRRS